MRYTHSALASVCICSPPQIKRERDVHLETRRHPDNIISFKKGDVFLDAVGKHRRGLTVGDLSKHKQPFMYPFIYPFIYPSIRTSIHPTNRLTIHTYTHIQ